MTCIRSLRDRHVEAAPCYIFFDLFHLFIMTSSKRSHLGNPYLGPKSSPSPSSLYHLLSGTFGLNCTARLHCISLYILSSVHVSHAWRFLVLQARAMEPLSKKSPCIIIIRDLTRMPAEIYGLLTAATRM